MTEYLFNDGKTDKAETLFLQLMEVGVQDPIAFNNLIRGHAKEGNPDSPSELAIIMARRNIPSEASAYKLLTESSLRKGEPAGC